MHRTLRIIACYIRKWQLRMEAMECGMVTQRAAVLRTFIASSVHESAEQKAGRPRKYEGSWISSLS